MRYTLMIVVVLGWYSAIGFTVWALWSSGHPVWACIVAIVGAGSPSLTEVSK